jgi:hypothetical protein
MKRRVLADMHTHLNEKKIRPEKWWTEVKKKKLSIVAITEHSYCKPREAYLKLKRTQPKGVLLIPGLEAKTSAGDVLFFGENESIYDIKELEKKDVRIEDALKAAKKNNILISFAHPYGYKYDAICEVIGEEKSMQLAKKYSAGAEYYNGMLGSANELMFNRAWIKKFYGMLAFFEKNRATKTLRISKTTHATKEKMEEIALDVLERVRKGMLFARKTDFFTAGSDAHYPKSIGSAVIELKKIPKDEKDFLKMIKTKQIIRAGPNFYSKKPIDAVSRKEMIEGLMYLTKKNVMKKRKIKIIKKIPGKIGLGKGIKTIKQISKKAKTKMPRLKLKKKLEMIGEKLGLEK